MTATKTHFKEGDLVYAPYHGYGMVTKICKEHCVYPIIVEWYPDNPFMETSSSFTEDGYLLVGTSKKDSNLKITVVKRRHNHRTLLNRFRAFLKVD